MNLIRLQNIYSWLKSDDDELKTLLWKSLRFPRKNYYHSTLYKQRKWDGYDEFFKKDSGRFLTGLLPEVLKAMELLKRKYVIDDQRETFKFAIQDVDNQFLNQWLPKGEKPFTLYDYQVDYIKQVSRVHRGIVLAPTGAGKTQVMIGILKCLPQNCPTLVMTKGTNLTRQIYKDITDWGFTNCGKCYGSKKEDFKPNMITVANIESVHKIERLLPHIRCVIVDEIHLMMSKLPKISYKMMATASCRIGLSATPFKFGETDKSQKYETKGFFGPVLTTGGRVLTTKELQERGILAPSLCTFYPIDQPELPYETYQDATTMGIAESVYFNQIVAKLAKKLKGRTLIIVERIAQGEMLNQLIKGSHWVYGKDDDEARDKVKNLLRQSDKCVCIVQQKLISAGINVLIHNMICAMGGKADHDIIQRMGRGLRTAKDKDILNYYDFDFRMNDYLMDHSNHRMKVLRNEGHKIVVKDEIDF